MKKLLDFFKNNSPFQNLFLVIASFAVTGTALQSNYEAVIAWICCFVIFIMFRGERDQNIKLREQLNEARIERFPELQDVLKQTDSLNK